MKKASAIITNKGGRTCHAAIVAREMGVLRNVEPLYLQSLRLLFLTF